MQFVERFLHIFLKDGLRKANKTNINDLLLNIQSQRELCRLMSFLGEETADDRQVDMACCRCV